jgi:hypothetical protein
MPFEWQEGYDTLSAAIWVVPTALCDSFLPSDRTEVRPYDMIRAYGALHFERLAMNMTRAFGSTSLKEPR